MLKADVVALIAVQSPSHYRSIVLPVADAEQAAQLNLNGYHRQLKGDGGKRAPSKIWTDLEGSLKPRKDNLIKDAERAYLKPFEGKWDTLGGLLRA